MTTTTTPRPDRRRARTRKMLSDALMSLILERGYDAITIQDITDKANLSRATFYLHYGDKEELYLSSLADVYDELVATKPTLTKAELMPDGVPPSLMVFRQAAANRDLYRVVLRAQNAGSIVSGIKAYVADELRTQMETFARGQGITTLVLPMDVLIEHMASSMIGLVVWWLETEATYTPEAMAAMFHRLNVSAWLYVLGIDADATPDTPR